jgi:hypothetical protein
MKEASKSIQYWKLEVLNVLNTCEGTGGKKAGNANKAKQEGHGTRDT